MMPDQVKADMEWWNGFMDDALERCAALPDGRARRELAQDTILAVLDYFAVLRRWTFRRIAQDLIQGVRNRPRDVFPQLLKLWEIARPVNSGGKKIKVTYDIIQKWDRRRVNAVDVSQVIGNDYLTIPESVAVTEWSVKRGLAKPDHQSTHVAMHDSLALATGQNLPHFAEQAEPQDCVNKTVLRRDARLAVLSYFDAWSSAAGLPVKRAARHFATLYNSGSIEAIPAWVREIVQKVSPRSIERWLSIRRRGAFDRLC